MFNKIMIITALIFIFCAAAVLAEPGPDDLVFFANKASVKTEKLTLKELEQIFLSKLTNWPDKSGAITPYNIAMDTPEREALQKKVLNMSSEDEKKYWVQKRIEGKENPPESKKSAAMVQMMVSKMKGSIGYCFYKDIQASVKGDLLFLKIEDKDNSVKEGL